MWVLFCNDAKQKHPEKELTTELIKKGDTQIYQY